MLYANYDGTLLCLFSACVMPYSSASKPAFIKEQPFRNDPTLDHHRREHFSRHLHPITVLWARWKLSGTPRRGGKRSVSVQIEKGKDIKMTSAASSKTKSKSTSIAASGSREQPEAPDGGLNLQDRLLGRTHASSAHNAGKSYTTIGELNLTR